MADARPIPTPTSFTKPFWEGAKAGRLRLQRCKDCGTVTYYPRPACMRCLSLNLEWVDTVGTGTVYSYTVTRLAPAGFKEDVPYVLVSVDLPEGQRILATLVDCAPDQARIGMPVRVDFRQVTGDISLPVFRPAA